jgi:hypothetical protein
VLAARLLGNPGGEEGIGVGTVPDGTGSEGTGSDGEVQ